MKEYFALVCALCVLVALGGLLSYGEKNGAARAAMGVVLMCTVALPPIKATLALREVDIGAFFEGEGTDQNSSALEEVVAESFSLGTKKMVCEKFSISEDDVSVHVFGLDSSSMRAEKIVVVLRGKGALSDIRRIGSAVEDAGLGKCEVKIEAS